MSDDVNKTDAAGGDSFNLFIPITKIDEEKREVYGVGAVEIADRSNQIFDYATSKPRIQKWSSETALRSQGKSLGNVREMHKASAVAGKVIKIDFDDAGKRVLLGSKIVDDAAWNKVKEGVYTGYSIGGNYANIWPDNSDFGKMRYTAEPTEWSLVDAPCIPGSIFTVIKAEGAEPEARLFKGMATGETLLIEKAIPEAPETLAAIALDVVGSAKPTASNTPTINPISTSVERQPDPAQIMEIKPDTAPTGETLAAHNDTAKSLEADFNKFLTVFEAKINKVLDAAEARLAALDKETPSAPAERQMIKVMGGGTRKIAVRHSVGLIKVNRKGDSQ
jgi:hypothetical protein